MTVPFSPRYGPFADSIWPGAESERPAPRRRRLDDVEACARRDEPDPVQPLQREDRLLDHRAVGLRVVDDPAIHVAVARLAEVGEPEAAGAVEHEIVGPAQLHPVARVVQRLEFSGLGVDDLDEAALVVVALRDREQLAGPLHEFQAAVVGHVDLAARTHRGAVRPAAERRDHAHPAVGHDARERAPLDLDQHHRAVAHRHRTLGESQARRDLRERWGDRLQGCPPGRRVYFGAGGLSARAYSGGRARKSSRHRHVAGSLTSSRNPSSSVAATAGSVSM